MERSMVRKNFHKQFKFSLRKIVDKQIDNFFEIENLNYIQPKHSYKIGDNVMLNEHHFLHGIGRNEKAVDFVAENGIVAKEALGTSGNHAVKFVSGFWRVNEATTLSNYIKNYSGMDVCYEKEGKLIPYKQIDKWVEEMRNVDHWKWKAESPMEIRFMPSLARDINQYGFILDVSSDYAKRLIKNDVNTKDFNTKLKRKCGFGNLNGNGKKDGVFNYINRASYIVLGLNRCFIEGVLVGRLAEKDSNKLKELKTKFPHAYICNLDGKVIVK